MYVYASWSWNHIGKRYHTIASSHIRVEKELLDSKTSIAHRFITIENINNRNLKTCGVKDKIDKNSLTFCQYYIQNFWIDRDQNVGLSSISSLLVDVSSPLLKC
jgi:hypothetical protein